MNVGELLQTAQTRTGLADFGPADFMEGLTLLVDGINREAEIRDNSWEQVRARLLRLLMNRLWFAKDLADHPEMQRENLGLSLIIVSLPRTGTTKLQRLLGASDDFQVHRWWQEHMFARIPGLDEGGKARRIAETRECEQWMYDTSPAILTGHPTFTDEPDEDIWLMEATFRHEFIFGLFDSPSYVQWAVQADLQPAFDYLFSQLKYLQWQSASPKLKPWLLKGPNHMGKEKYLMPMFEKPRFIVTHRDPCKCLPSVTATAMAMRKLYSDRDGSAMISAGVVNLFVKLLHEHMAWRDSHADVPILDLSFREINEDGVATAKKVYDFLDMPLSRAAEDGMRNWEQNNRREKHPKSNYSAEGIGTTDAAIREACKPYIDRYAEFF